MAPTAMDPVIPDVVKLKKDIINLPTKSRMGFEKAE